MQHGGAQQVVILNNGGSTGLVIYARADVQLDQHGNPEGLEKLMETIYTNATPKDLPDVLRIAIRGTRDFYGQLCKESKKDCIRKVTISAHAGNLPGSQCMTSENDSRFTFIRNDVAWAETRLIATPGLGKSYTVLGVNEAFGKIGQSGIKWCRPSCTIVLGGCGYYKKDPDAVEELMKAIYDATKCEVQAFTLKTQPKASGDPWVSGQEEDPVSTLTKRTGPIIESPNITYDSSGFHVN